MVDNTAVTVSEDKVRLPRELGLFCGCSSVSGIVGLEHLGEGKGGRLLGAFGALGILFKIGMCFFMAVETRNRSDADVSTTVELKIVSYWMTFHGLKCSRID